MLTELRTHLLDTITCPIYPGWIKECQALPAITYNVTGSEHEYTLDKASGFASYEVQFDVWASTYAEAQSLAESIRQALQGLEVNGHYCQLTSQVDVTEQPDEGTEEATYHVVSEYRIIFNESIPT